LLLVNKLRLRSTAYSPSWCCFSIIAFWQWL